MSCIALAIGLALGVAPSVAQAADESPIPIAEAPNDVAIADDGTTLASMLDLKQVAIIRPDRTVTTVTLECAPSAVAIAPEGDRGWVVCQTNPHVFGLNVATGELISADVGLEEAVQAIYVPAKDLLVVGDYSGEVVVVSVTSPDDYQVRARIATNKTLDSISVSGDAKTAFTVGSPGELTRIDLTNQTFDVLKLTSPDTSIWTTALSPLGTILFAGAYESSTSATVLLGLNPQTGATLQRLPVPVINAWPSRVAVAAGSRQLYVGISNSVTIGSDRNGLFAVALDARGRMGELSALTQESRSIRPLSLSNSRERLAAGDVGGRGGNIVRLSVADEPVAPGLTVTGRIDRTMVRVTGASEGLALGTPITVYTKVVGAKKARFVAHPRRAVVGADGVFRWSGKIPAARVSIYVMTGTVKSPVITISR